MIISVDKVKQHVNTTKDETVLGEMLQALELLIRKYTNNKFQKVNIRTSCQVMTRKLYTSYPYFKVGDTVEISQSIYNDGLYVVKETDGEFIILDKDLVDEATVLVTKVEYPMDVQMGVLTMLEWDLKNRKKVGIQSETISRHSVTYYDQSASNTVMGYPISLLGFLKPYMKCRF